MLPHERVDALTYRSEGTELLTDAELEVVLVRSRALNAVRGITGVLVTCERSIVQYLEGPPASLARTFPAIEASPLHRNVQVLARAEAVTRRFDRWHMGFARFQPMNSRDEDTREWLATLAMLRGDPLGNPAFAALLDTWDAIARPPARPVARAARSRVT